MSCLFQCLMTMTHDCTALRVLGLVLLARDAACRVSGHRDGMWQLALLLCSMPARREPATFWFVEPRLTGLRREGEGGWDGGKSVNV